MGPKGGATISAQTQDRIRAMAADGMSRRELADTLNTQGVSTARGGRWSPSTVHGVLARAKRS